MKKEDIPVITDREKLYDKCENMEQLFDKYYLPLLDKHYSKTYKLQQENKQLKDNWNKLKIWLEEYNIANEKWYSNELSNHDREFYKKDYLDCKFFINKFIDKMQELEQGSDSNE